MRFFVVLLTLFCLCYPLDAQEWDRKFNNISIQEGLSQNTVWCISEDELGFIWVGTTDGLNCYTGYEMKVYNAGERGLQNDIIYSLLKDRKGNLWVGTDEGYLHRFDPNSDNFIGYRLSLPGIPSSQIFIPEILEDSQGLLWLGTSVGLFSFEPLSAKFSHYPLKPEFKINTPYFLNKMVLDAKDQIWMVSQDWGLVMFDTRGKRFSLLSKDPSSGLPAEMLGHFAHSIYLDVPHHIWIGTSRGGLYRYDTQTLQVIHYHKGSKDYPLGDNHVNAIHRDSLGNLWVATEGGGISLLKSGGEFELLLKDNRIQTLYEDQVGSIWVGSWRNGVFQYNSRNTQFHHHQISFGVYALFEDRAGTVWAGTQQGGLLAYQPEEKGFTPPIDSKLKWDVLGISEDQTGALWLGTAHGLRILGPDRKSYSTFSHPLPDQTPHDKFTVWCMLTDHEGMIWLGTASRGLLQLDPSTQHLKQYPHDPTVNQSLSSNTVFSILEDSKNNLWLGTKSGLNLMKTNSKTFKHFTHDPRNTNSISHNLVQCIFERSNGELWVGTKVGLNHMKSWEGIFERYTVEDGLPNNVIYRIQEDNGGNLWISTNRGLSKFNPVTRKFLNYDVEDGLQSLEFNLASCRTREGEMFFGGINGINRFYPKLIKTNPHPPQVILTNITVINRGKSRNLHGDIPQLKLTYLDRSVTFGYTAINYIQTTKNRYAYMLEGFDEKWNPAGSRRYVTYTNLPGGEYTFRVKASNNDGLWNQEGVSLNMVVYPPFWKTWWFILLVVLFILVIAIAAHMWRVRQVILREQNKYGTSPLTEKESESYLNKLTNIMETEKPHLDPNLTMKDLGDLVALRPNYLSQIINDKRNQNFYEFINSYRIEEAKRILADPEFESRTILDVAYASGFNTKSAFNRAFKQFTNQTPSEFKKNALK